MDPSACDCSAHSYASSPARSTSSADADVRGALAPARLDDVDVLAGLVEEHAGPVPRAAEPAGLDRVLVVAREVEDRAEAEQPAGHRPLDVLPVVDVVAREVDDRGDRGAGVRRHRLAAEVRVVAAEVDDQQGGRGPGLHLVGAGTQHADGPERRVEPEGPGLALREVDLVARGPPLVERDADVREVDGGGVGEVVAVDAPERVEGGAGERRGLRLVLVGPGPRGELQEPRGRQVLGPLAVDGAHEERLVERDAQPGVRLRAADEEAHDEPLDGVGQRPPGLRGVGRERRGLRVREVGEALEDDLEGVRGGGRGGKPLGPPLGARGLGEHATGDRVREAVPDPDQLGRVLRGREQVVGDLPRGAQDAPHVAEEVRDRAGDALVAPVGGHLLGREAEDAARAVDPLENLRPDLVGDHEVGAAGLHGGRFRGPQVAVVAVRSRFLRGRRRRLGGRSRRGGRTGRGPGPEASGPRRGPEARRGGPTRAPRAGTDGRACHPPARTQPSAGPG